MNRFFAGVLFAIVCIAPVIVFAQAKTIYYDSDGKQTEKGNASYYRNAELQQGGEYYIQDHYLNGHLQMTGYYTCPTFDDSCRTGHVVFYDSSGNVEAEEEYSKGRHVGIWKHYYSHSTNLEAEEIYSSDMSPAILILYDTVHRKIATGHILNGKKDGTYQEYYASNGLLKAVCFYKDNMKEGLYTEYDIQTHTPIIKGAFLHDKKAGAWGYYTPTGNISLIMNFEGDIPEGPATFYNPFSQKKRKEYNFHKGKLDGRAYVYFLNGNIDAELNYKDDSLDGEQKYYYLDGGTERVDHYNNGAFIGGKYYDEKGNSKPYTSLSPDDQKAVKTNPYYKSKLNHSQYVYVTRMPMPSVDINEFLSRNLHYPVKARDNGIQGRVVLKFIVLKDGRISNIHVVSGIGGGCDEEAIRVLSLMPRWKPGMNDGEPVDVYYTFPISFRLK